MIAGIEDSHHGSSDAMHNPPSPLKISQKILVSFLTEINTLSINFLTPSRSHVHGKPNKVSGHGNAEHELTTQSVGTDIKKWAKEKTKSDKTEHGIEKSERK
ncbi:hypothetical protein Tco_1460191 [Tanacetum coccineum]